MTPTPEAAMTKEEREKLKELALAARDLDDPWWHSDALRRATHDVDAVDLDFIAACDPQTILSLLAAAETVGVYRSALSFALIEIRKGTAADVEATVAHVLGVDCESYYGCNICAALTNGGADA